jgi:hypothetical protein
MPAVRVVQTCETVLRISGGRMIIKTELTARGFADLSALMASPENWHRAAEGKVLTYAYSSDPGPNADKLVFVWVLKSSHAQTVAGGNAELGHAVELEVNFRYREGVKGNKESFQLKHAPEHLAQQLWDILK